MQKYAIEFLGTLFLAFVVLATGNYLAIGAALVVGLLLANGAYNPAAYNPAVAFSLYLNGTLTASTTGGYIVAELLGGLAAYGLYKLVYKR